MKTSPIVRSKKFIDIIVLVLWIIASGFIVNAIQARILGSTAIFFVIPTVYLFIRAPKNYRKIFTAALVFGLLWGFGFHYLATLNEAWNVPRSQLVIPLVIFDVVEVDALLWYFFLVLFIVTFYEHFLDHDITHKISKNLPIALIPTALAILMGFVMAVIDSQSLRFSYSYLVLGSAAIIPMIYLLIKKSQLILKFVMLNLFFIFLFLVFELTSLHLEQWSFHGQYIGKVELFGLPFAFEEFVFWICLGAPTFVAYYELFIDDER